MAAREYFILKCMQFQRGLEVYIEVIGDNVCHDYGYLIFFFFKGKYL